MQHCEAAIVPLKQLHASAAQRLAAQRPCADVRRRASRLLLLLRRLAALPPLLLRLHLAQHALHLCE